MGSERVGGKAASLERARDAGLPVPAFAVLGPEEVRVLVEGDPGDERTLRARELVAASLESLGDACVAVRSSGVGEDGEASFAGQLHSVVGVSGLDETIDAVRVVGASGSAELVRAYGASMGVELGAVAVILQRSVETEWAGVAFCRDPVTCQPEIVVEAVCGPGSLLVDGSTTPSRTVLCRETRDVIVPPGEDAQALPPHVLRAVGDLAMRAEELFGAAQDIEWGWDGGRLWLLQSRPMTALDGLEVYSDTFAAEVWPGLIKPLVFDVGNRSVNNAWGRLLTAIAGPVDVDWQCMAGRAASRAYFNDSLLGDVLSYAGLPENALEAIERGERPRLREGSVARMVASATRLVGFALANRTRLRTVEREVQSLRERARSLAAGASDATAAEVARRFDELLDLLEDAAYLSVLAMIGMGLRGMRVKLLARLLRAGGDVNALATPRGEGPISELDEVARHVHELSEAELALFETATTSEIHEVLDRTEAGRQARLAMDAFLEHWGHVATVNTDFSAPTWRDDPMLLWRLSVRTKSVPRVSDEADRALERTGWLLRRHVMRLRRSVVARDEVNDALALVYDGLRVTARRAGNLLTPSVIPAADGVYCLTLDELFSALRGESGPLHDVVEQRQAALVADADVSPPHRLWGLRLPPRWRMLDVERAESVASEGELRGTPASAGTFTGTARVVTDFAEAPKLGPGDVLVIAHADVGWTPLFGVVGAVVTGTGGGLSHAAIVARERGVPAVLGVSDATLAIPDRSRVSVDGTEGIVRVLHIEPEGNESRSDKGDSVWRA
ncbi:MAG: PEP/pyruvate-binding domain-containing protein [Anaerosomatales bacterium]|nr:PEP/pyruvate-binding domain-containing protein [Anaerosomatales bacterium]